MPRPGTTTQRGYGRQHQLLRAKLLPKAYGQPCPRCGHTMHRWQTLDLGHHDDDRTRYTGIEHANCNRSAAASKGNRARGRRQARRAPPIEIMSDLDDL